MPTRAEIGKSKSKAVIVRLEPSISNYVLAQTKWFGAMKVEYKLKKELYSLKHTPKAWYEKQHDYLLQFGFFSSKYDHSLFINKHQVLL